MTNQMTTVILESFGNINKKYKLANPARTGNTGYQGIL